MKLSGVYCVEGESLPVRFSQMVKAEEDVGPLKVGGYNHYSVNSVSNDSHGVIAASYSRGQEIPTYLPRRASAALLCNGHVRSCEESQPLVRLKGPQTP